jgi:hypothetical protein
LDSAFDQWNDVVFRMKETEKVQDEPVPTSDNNNEAAEQEQEGARLA